MPNTKNAKLAMPNVAPLVKMAHFDFFKWLITLKLIDFASKIMTIFKLARLSLTNRVPLVLDNANFKNRNEAIRG